ncbi:MAG: hypothetical protein PHY15_01330 [Eubacteriales bacterium]|nr:hypothetical protein [Eubacteriales bacterium]MDD4475061.1 hypothetical protein [Eubacteriales bacterium]
MKIEFNRFKSATAAFLLISVLFTLFSCTVDSPDDSSAAEISTVVEESVYTLPEKDLDGAVIKFVVPGSTYAYYESFDIYADETGHGLINDTVYERNMVIQDKYKCKIEEEKMANISQYMLQMVNAGDETNNVYMPMLNDAVRIIPDNVMLDLTQIENLALDMPWWDQNLKSDLSMAGKLYFATGDISTLDNDCTMVVFFNKKLIRDYELENPYTLVENNEWTLDKVYTMSKVGTISNGDDVWDNKDKYGLHVAFNAPHSFYFGSGGTLASIDENKNISIGLKNESNITKLIKVFEVSYAHDVVTNKTSGCNTFEAICEMFMNDQIIFTTFALIDIKQFKEKEGFEFGILPYPLYDSSQKNYYNFISTSLVPVITIPKTCPNPEDTALIVEAMAYYSKDTLTKAYYDVTLKHRDLQDKESGAMLDIIFASRVYDLGYIYNWGGIGMLIENMNSRNSDNIVSEFQAIESAVQAAINETLESLDFLN